MSSAIVAVAERPFRHRYSRWFGDGMHAPCVIVGSRDAQCVVLPTRGREVTAANLPLDSWGKAPAGINDKQTLPKHLVAYKRTPTFTETTIPAGLLKDHTTKAGTWGRIVVLRGRLRYRILAPELEEVLLTPELNGVVEPLVPHEVRPEWAVEFYVEFYSAPDG